jgi:Tol biopolymer transport system component
VAWSPDGKQVVFGRADCDVLSELLAVPFAGGVPRLIHRFRGPTRGVAWEPHRIAYTDVYGTLWTMTPNGKNVRKIALGVGPFAWSRDGRLAYVSQEAGLATIVVVGSRVRIHVHLDRVSSLAWSPDDREFAITARPGSAVPSELYTVGTDGKHLRQLTYNFGPTGASWH